jgi:hypothetical protein
LRRVPAWPVSSLHRADEVRLRLTTSGQERQIDPLDIAHPAEQVFVSVPFMDDGTARSSPVTRGTLACGWELTVTKAALPTCTGQQRSTCCCGKTMVKTRVGVQLGSVPYDAG